MAAGLGAGLLIGGLVGYSAGRSHRKPEYVYVVPAKKVKVVKATTTRKKKKSTRKKKR
jgi:hypothetical protein